MGAKEVAKKELAIFPLCQALTHLPGFPKHLREWWCHMPTPCSLLEAIQEYKFRCAPDKEQDVLQGMLKKISQVVDQGPSHTGFLGVHAAGLGAICNLLHTPLGILRPVSRHFWSLPDKNNEYSELN